MKTKIIIIASFLVAVGVILALTMKPDGKDGASTAGVASAAAAASGAVLPAAQTEIRCFTAPRRKTSSRPRRRASRRITRDQGHLNAKGSIAAAQAIVDGKEKPTVFSAADTLVQNLLASDWQTKNRTDLFATSGDDAPQPLVITPPVFVAWEDRAEVLLKAAGGAITWKSIHKAVTSNEGWPAIKGKSEWGFVKLGHTDPTQSNSGLQALLSMTLEYQGKTTGLEVGDILASSTRTSSRSSRRACRSSRSRRASS